MKRFLNTVAAVFAAACLATGAAAQETPRPSLDKEIETAEKRLNELKQQQKQQRRDELQRQIRALQTELERTDGGTVATPPLTAASPGDTVNAGGHGAFDGTGHGGGGSMEGAATGVGSSGGSVSSGVVQTGGGGGQTDNKCLQAATGAVTLNRFDKAVCDLARDVVADPSLRIDPTSEEALLVTLWFGQIARGAAVNAAEKEFVLGAEVSRADKQIGADPKSSGTTSLAVKGGIPSVLGWATEHGAAIASRDGTTVTFRFNPVGAVEALAGQGYISSFQNNENDPLVKFFRNTAVGVSFDTSRGTDPPTLIGSKQQVSAVSFRYQFINQREPRSRRYRNKWTQFINEAGLDLTNAQSDALMQLETGSAALVFSNKALQKWLDDTNAAIGAQESNLRTLKATLQGDAARDAVRKTIEQRLALLPAAELSQDPVLINAVTGFVTASRSYTAKKRELLDEIGKGTVVSFEYTNHREVNAPDLSNFRFIAERGTVGGLDFTGNASVTIFNKRPTDADAKRLKDFSFALQLDKRLNDTMGLGDSTLSFAGKFERVMSNAVALDGTVLPNTKGDIAAGQVKLTIPLGETGIKLPLSFTFANRTELVREKEVRGNFGFTLDFDTLFARFKPFAK